MIPELLNKDTPSQPSPVSPASLSGGSFFLQEDTGFFNSPLRNQAPLPETKAHQLGFAAAVLSGENEDDMDGISYQTTNELMSYGSSSVIDSIRRQLEQADEIDTYRSIWTNEKFLNSAQLDPELGRQVQAEAQAELKALKFQNESARIMAEAAAKLTPAQKELAQDLTFVTEEIMYQQAIDQVLQSRSADATEKASFWNWVSLLNPVSPITSRYDQSKLSDIISSSLGTDPNYVLKSDHSDAIDNFFLDPKLTVGELMSRVDQAEELFKSIDYEAESVNPLWSAEFFDVLRSSLADKDQSLNLGTIYDAVDATVVGAEAINAIKAVRKISTWVKAKTIGKAAMVSERTTPEQIEEIVAMMERGLKTDWRIQPSGLLKEAPAATPVGKPARAKEIEAQLVVERQKASGTVPRKERKELEARKQEIGAEIDALARDDLKALTKTYQEEGMKFKEAKKRAAAEIEQQKLTKQAELDALQADIDLVDSFSAAKANVSRLEQELAGLQAPVPVQRSKVSVSVSNAIQDRGSMLDTVVTMNPTAARAIVSNVVKENPEDLRNLGVTPETVAQRIVPNPQDGLGVHAAVLTGRTSLYQKFKESLDDLNPSDLLTAKELANVPSIWGKAVQQHSTGTLFSTHSELVRLDDSGDLVLRGVFGGSVDGGFSNIDDAAKALNDLFGGQGKLKSREIGSNQPLRDYDDYYDTHPDFTNEREFFIEVEQTLRVDPNYVSPFEKDWVAPMVPFAPYAVDVARRIQKDLFDGISAWSDKATRIAGIQQQMLAPVKSLGEKDKAVWAELLLKGDNDEVVYATKEEASLVLGKKVSDKTWEAYRGVRDYYDSVAEVRQRSVYKHLQMNGFKTLRGADGSVVEDLGGMIHVRPIYQKPLVVGRPVTGDALITPDNVWGKEIFDMRTNTPVPLTADKLEDIYNSGGVVARVSREAEFSEGNSFEFVVIDPAKATDLVRNPMNIRRGHVDMNYKGEDSIVRQLAGGYKGGNSYKVQVRGTKKVNGEDLERLTTIGLYANAKQARAARERLIVQEVRNGKSLEEATNMYPDVELTREGVGELGLDMAGTYTGIPAHARKRGDVNIMTQGNQLAETLAVEDSLSRSLGETRRLLNVDAIEMMKRRFGQTYADIMDNFDGFHADFERFSVKGTAELSRIGEAKRAHEVIMNLDHALSNRQYVLFMDKVAAYSHELMAADSAFKGWAGKVLNDISKTKLDNEIKKLTATLLIAARLPYQVVANSALAANLFMANPVVFAGTIRRTLSTMLAISNLKIDSRLLNAAAARLGGFTDDEFAQYMKNLRASGIMRSGAGADVTALLGESAKVEAGAHAVNSMAFWKRMVPGLGGVERTSKVLMIPQHVATDLVNLMAYNHSFGLVMEKVGRNAALSRRNQIEVSAGARRLTQHQNRTSQFAYQQNWSSLQLMFFQHVHRMYMDLILDPFARTVTGNKFGVSKHGTNPYAKDWLTSLRTMTMMSALWGVGTYPLLDNNGVTDAAKEVGATPEAISLLQDGLVHKAVKDIYGQGYNVAARFSPKGALESMYEMMFTPDGGLKLGGPVNYLTDTASKLAKLSMALHNSDPMDRELALELINSTASALTTGTNDVYRAMIAANIGEYVDSSGKTLTQTMDTAWIPILFSLQPDAVKLTYDERNAVFERKDKANEIAKWITRWAMQQYADAPTDNNNIESIWIKGMRACELASGEDLVLAQLAKEQFMKMEFGSEELQERLVNEIMTVYSVEDARTKLEALLKVNPDSEFIKLSIQALGTE